MKKWTLCLAALAGLIWSLVSLAADFNGDGTNDVGIFRPAEGLWAVKDLTRVFFGSSSDLAIPGDYDGNGTVNMAVFRPSTGLWALMNRTRIYFGQSNDEPLIGVFGARGGQWSQTTGGIYFNGNIGVGTASPSTALEVNGTVTATGGNSLNWNTAYSERLEWDGGATNLNPAAGRTALGLGNVQNINVQDTFTQNNSQYIGTDSIQARDSGGLKLYDGNGMAGVFVKNGGQVGIGTSSPNYALDVNGDVNLASNQGYRIGGLEIVNNRGTESVQIGAAGTFNTGTYLTAVGQGAGNENTGFANTFIGRRAGYHNVSTFAYNNTFVGESAGFSNHSGGMNTFIGQYAGYQNNSGDYNTFVGRAAGMYNRSSLADLNTFVGYQAGFSNGTGNSNVFIGADAGGGNSEGSNNTFVGRMAGYGNTQGYDNSCFGSKAGGGFAVFTDQAFGNTFLGMESGYFCVSGNSNTFSGLQSGYMNSTGDQNIFCGYWAGYNNTDGGANVFIGNESGYNNLTGSRNVALGYEAGHASRGDSNVFIGYRAGYSELTGSSKLYVANGPNNTDVLIYGDFSSKRVGIGTVTPGYALDVAGDINTTGDIRKNGTIYNNPDYVFESSHPLMPLNDLKTFISQEKHLPGMPSSEEIKRNGVYLFEQNRRMMEKLEEAYLYILKQHDDISRLEKRLARLETGLR